MAWNPDKLVGSIHQRWMMPKDFAPILRNIALFGVLGLLGLFGLAMKSGGFKSDGLVVIIVLSVLVLGGAFAALAAIDSEAAHNVKIPNPLHPDNRPTEPPAS